MDGSATATALPFLPLAASRAGVRLRCLRRFDAPPGAAILVHCRGIEVGRRPLYGSLAAGTEIEVPVERLPRVALPAELRFSLGAEGPEVAPPWPLPNPAAALALLGPGEVVVEELRLEQGVLRGFATDRVNGLLEPVMFARINDSGARGVVVERPSPLPEGGCAFRFSLPLEPGDLNETGLSVAIHLVGQEAPVARYAYARIGLEGPVPRLAELESRIERLERGAASTLRQMQEELRRQIALQRERTDAFIEAAASLLLDRLAGAAAAPVQTPPADGAIAALHRLVAAASAAPPPAEPLLLGRRAEIPSAAGNLAIGWHQPEQDEGGPFRWMADTALVVNPEPFRRVAAVTLTVRHLYGAEEPGLSGAFDGTPAAVAVSRDATTGRFAVRLTPEGGPVACQGLRLESPHAGCPERDGRSPDPRVLSVAVAAVVFEYAE